MRRTVSVIAAALAVGVASMGVAQATPAPSKDLCKSGGYAKYVDPATGQPFVDQGTCVTFVNNGGMLKPTPPPGPSIVVSGGWGVNYADDPAVPGSGDACSFEANGVTDTTNPDPNEDHTYLVLRDGQVLYSGYVLLPGNFGTGVTPDGSTVTLLIDGVNLGSWLAQPGCPMTPAS